MIQSMNDPRCYKAYVSGNFIHDKATQNNERGQLNMICFAGTNLPHQISNREQNAHFPIMITDAKVSALCTHNPSSASPNVALADKLN